MTQKEIEMLLVLVAKAANGDGSWVNRRDAIREVASSEDLVNLGEFASWWMEEGGDMA